jgi:hypothetical protein
VVRIVESFEEVEQALETSARQFKARAGTVDALADVLKHTRSKEGQKVVADVLLEQIGKMHGVNIKGKKVI